jgi:hypothetical protein
MAANARRQRQTYDKCGPRMQQAGCDLVSRTSSDFMDKWERNGPKSRRNGVCPLSGLAGTGDAFPLSGADSRDF